MDATEYEMDVFFMTVAKEIRGTADENLQSALRHLRKNGGKILMLGYTGRIPEAIELLKKQCLPLLRHRPGSDGLYWKTDREKLLYKDIPLRQDKQSGAKYVAKEDRGKNSCNRFQYSRSRVHAGATSCSEHCGGRGECGEIAEATECVSVC